MSYAQTINFKNEGASAKLERLQGQLYTLRNLYAHIRRQGWGSQVMRTVTDYADNNDIVLLLVAQPYGPVNHPHLDTKQLVMFYEQFGFQTNPDHKHIPHMIRYPSREKHGT